MKCRITLVHGYGNRASSWKRASSVWRHFTLVLYIYTPRPLYTHTPSTLTLALTHVIYITSVGLVQTVHIQTLAFYIHHTAEP